MEYILGIDGGGSKTTVLIADLYGNIISRAVSGASSYKSIGKNKLVKNLNNGIFEAISNLGSPEEVYFKSSCFVFADNDTEKDFRINKEIVFNDVLVSYLDPGIIIICNDSTIGIVSGCNNK